MAPNWFVALPVRAVGWYEQGLPPLPAGFSRMHPADLHLTIAFLGPVSEAAARRGWDALDWPLTSARVTLGAVVPMGDARRYSALAAELDEGRAAVESAMGACRDVVCDAAGAPRERRPPRAHLTVARPGRSAADADRADGLAWARKVLCAGVALGLDRVALYGWSDDRSDQKFRIVHERALAP